MKRQSIWIFCLAALIAAAQGCGNQTDGKKQAAAPAKVEKKAVGEAALTTIELTPQAKERLGIETEEAEYRAVPKTYSATGEVVIPPGQSLTVSAPVAGSVTVSAGILPTAGQRIEKDRTLFQITPLLPVERNLRVNAEADVAAAETRVQVARTRAERAAQMLRDGVGSVRAREDADEAVQLAETSLNAARARIGKITLDPVSTDTSVAIEAPQSGILRQIHVAQNQIVMAGAVLCEIVQLDPVWIRTPVYSGDVHLIARDKKVEIRPINAAVDSDARNAVPVHAPPSADPISGTTDLFYSLSNSKETLHPGERVSVLLPVKGEVKCLRVPYASILYDIHGGAWVYERTDPFVFVRRRVSLESVSGESACLSDGILPGAAVVTDGAAELFGTEFGTGK